LNQNKVTELPTTRKKQEEEQKGEEWPLDAPRHQEIFSHASRLWLSRWNIHSQFKQVAGSYHT